MAAIDRLIAKAKEGNASDLHLADGQPPKLRRVTNLETVPGEAALDAATLSALLREIAPQPQWEKLESRGDARFAYSPDAQTRVRVSCYKHLAGRGAVCRVIRNDIRSPQELGISPTLSEQIKSRSGVVLVSGPTGAGVSTTIAALINQIIQEQERRILILEEPLEFLFESKRSLVSQRDLGAHVHDFAGAMREAPHAGYDVVYAGELDSKEKITLALTTAEAGVLVLATMRNNSVVRALENMVNSFSPEQQHWIRVMMGNSLRCVCAQLMLPRVDGSGRCIANEILVNTTGVGSAIREGYISKLSTMIQSGGADGMMSMDDALWKLVEAGLAAGPEALNRASDKNRFQAKLSQPETPPPAPAGNVQMPATPAAKPGAPAPATTPKKPDAPPKSGLGRFFGS